MRLIDADAIVFTHAIARSIDDGHNWNELCVTKDEIDDMPSAEPELKKGKWLPHPIYREWDVCSVCGTGCKRREYELQFGQEKETEYVYPYCPHCGARLEWE